eukprot:COSAG06_NODE_5439_length_3481_cov_6.214666_3_plen_143_part_00
MAFPLGIPGSIDLKHWRDACAFADRSETPFLYHLYIKRSFCHDRLGTNIRKTQKKCDACAFADSFADLGRWLDLWVEVARAKEAANDPEWITRTWVQVKLMAQYVHTLRANATKTAGISKGLIYGPAEFDEVTKRVFLRHFC